MKGDDDPLVVADYSPFFIYCLIEVTNQRTKVRRVMQDVKHGGDVSWMLLHVKTGEVWVSPFDLDFSDCITGDDCRALLRELGGRPLSELIKYFVNSRKRFRHD